MATAKKKTTKKKRATRKAPQKVGAIPRGGFFLDHFLTIFRAAAGFKGGEFTTSQMQRKTGLSYSSCYRWLKAMEAHKIVESWVDLSRTSRGDYRWRLLQELTPILKAPRKERTVS